MAQEVVGSSPTTHPILLSNMLGCSQVAKATDFDSVIRRFKSCHPSQPDPLAQSVEHLTFNQGVRSSNLRRVTNFLFGANAGVAELADAPDLGSGAARCMSSSLFARTSYLNFSMRV